MSNDTEKHKQKKVAEPLSATWKFDLIKTANRDTELSPSALKVLCAYLDLGNQKNPTPYIAMPVLMAETNLSEPTIKKARKMLVALKYLTRKGRSFGGAYRYELGNERQEIVAKAFAEARDRNAERYQNLPPMENDEKPGAKVSDFTPNGRDQNLPPNTGKPLIGSAAQADAALNKNLSHQLKGGENLSSRWPSAYAGPSEADEEIIVPSEADEIDLDLDSCPNIERPEYDPDGPHTGDLIEVGEGAFVQVEEAEDDAGTPRDPDGLTADRREDNAFDLAAFVASFVASRIDLSTIEHEPTLQIVLPIAADISDVTGIDLETVSRFVEDHLWNARRWDDDAENADDHPLANPF